MKKPLAFHPLLFAVSPVLFLYAHNIAELTIEEIYLPVAIGLAATALLLAVLSRFLGGSARAGVVLTPIILVFLIYGNILGSLKAALPVMAHHKLLIPALVALLVIAAYLLLRRDDSYEGPTRALNIASVLLLAMSAFNIVNYEVSHAGGVAVDRVTRDSGDERGTSSKASKSPGGKGAAEDQPDIYYIILDAYVGKNVLDTMYRYDNSEFYAELRKRGFYIADKSRPNYPLTFLSLSSSLNMQYVNDFATKLGPDSEDRKLPYRMIRDSKLSRFLQDRGYTYVFFRSGWGATLKNPYADVYYVSGVFNEFSTMLLRNTMFMPFVKKVVSSDKRDITLSTFRKLGQLPRKIKGPKFVFAHILLPHPPYLFGPNGEPVDQEELAMAGAGEKHKKGYMGQLQFANKKSLETIDRILATSKTPPIIILQGDHGSTTFSSLDEPGKDIYKERFSILNAYHLPKKRGTDQLYPGISPVNSFRVILSEFFGQKYKTLEDRSYFVDYAHPYRFDEITDSVTKYYDDKSVVGKAPAATKKSID